MVKPPHLRLQNAALRELLEGIQVVPQSARKKYWILWCCERWKNMSWSGWSYKGANLCCRSYIALSMLNIECWPVSSIFNIPHHQIDIFNIQKASKIIKHLQPSPAISSPLQPQRTRFSQPVAPNPWLLVALPAQCLWCPRRSAAPARRAAPKRAAGPGGSCSYRSPWCPRYPPGKPIFGKRKIHRKNDIFGGSIIVRIHSIYIVYI